MFKKYIRALRLPFITASILPFIFGSFIERQHFNFLFFIIGFICAGSTHLGANLINDYADSRSGADWKDKRFFGLFGGSKLIQEGELSESFYLVNGLMFLGFAACCVLLLSVFLNSLSIILYFLLIAFLGFSYSHKPFQFSYNRSGEFIIFLLFGPAVVMGAYFIQTKVFPDFRSFMLSVPFGLFTANILFSNEVPDYETDYSSKKYTLVSLVGLKNAYFIYYIILGIGLSYILLNVYLGFLSPIALFILPFAYLSFKAGIILKNNYNDKEKLVESSLLTIKFQTISSIILILSLLIK